MGEDEVKMFVRFFVNGVTACPLTEATVVFSKTGGVVQGIINAMKLDTAQALASRQAGTGGLNLIFITEAAEITDFFIITIGHCCPK
jgi:hypothetical protein